MNKSIIDVSADEIIARLRASPIKENIISSDRDIDSDILLLDSFGNISEKWNLPCSHRGLFLKRIFNFLLKKLYFSIKIFLGGIIHSQDLFNKKTIVFLRYFHQKIDSLDGDIAKLGEWTSKSEKKIDSLDGDIAKLGEWTSKSDQKIDSLDGDIAKLGEWTSKSDQKIDELYSWGNIFWDKINDLEGKNKWNDQLMTQMKEKDDVNINYFDFENKFRGSEASIQKSQESYLQYFEGKGNILDIGCGRGEFLKLLYNRGIGAKGIDIDQDFVAHCKKMKLNVDSADAVEYLREISDDCLDGITCFQVVEHLDNKYLIELLSLCYRKLKKDSFVIFETPNPKSLSIFANAFYIDLSHKKPVHPLTLEFLLRVAGFADVELQYRSFVSGDNMLSYKNNDDLDYKRNIDMLNTIVYGPQDYALIAKK